MFRGSVLLDNVDKVVVRKYNGMRYDYVIQFGDSCRVFLDIHQAEELLKALQDVLPNGKSSSKSRGKMMNE